MKTWWRLNSAVTHSERGHGVITNFVRCKKNCANVYFYEGQYTIEVPRRELARGGKNWHDYSGLKQFNTPIQIDGMLYAGSKVNKKQRNQVMMKEANE